MHVYRAVHALSFKRISHNQATNANCTMRLLDLLSDISHISYYETSTYLAYKIYKTGS